MTNSLCGKCCRNDTNNDPAQDTLGSADGVPAEDKEVHFSHCCFLYVLDDFFFLVLISLICLKFCRMVKLIQ